MVTTRSGTVEEGDDTSQGVQQGGDTETRGPVPPMPGAVTQGGVAGIEATSMLLRIAERMEAMQQQLTSLMEERANREPRVERVEAGRTRIGEPSFELGRQDARDLDETESEDHSPESGYPPVGLDPSAEPIGAETTALRTEAPVFSSPRPGVMRRISEQPTTNERHQAQADVSASEARGRAASMADPALASLLKDQIPVYDPDRTQGVKAWMQKFEEYIGILNLSALASRKIFLSSKLKGRASIWMESTGNTLRTWAQLRDAFLAEFVDVLAAERAWGALHRLRDQNSFQRYYQDFQRISRSTEEEFWSSSRLRSIFYFNLSARRKEKLLTYSYGQGRRVDQLTIKEMIEFLSLLDLAYATDSQDKSSGKEKKSASASKEASGNALKDKSSKDGFEERNRAIKKVICHGCGERGHYKSNCPNRKVTVSVVTDDDSQPSPVMDGMGEKPEFCRVFAEEILSSDDNMTDIKPLQTLVEAQEVLNKRARNRNVCEATAEVSKIFDRQKEMVIEIQISGITSKALVDTGATRSCIDIALTKKAQLQITGKPLDAKLADASVMRIQGETVAALEVLGKKITTKVMVCDLQNQDRPVILGRDILREIGVNIRLEKDQEEILQIDGDNFQQDNFSDEPASDEEVAATEAVIADQINNQNERPADATTELPREFAEFKDVFDPDDMAIPPVRPEYDMKIELVGQAPNSVRQYRLTHQEREELREQVIKLKQAGLIRHSESSTTSPVLFVPKKNGEKRMCIDYRRINAVTKTLPNQLPLIEDILDNLQGKQVFTSLDLRSGYHQLRMSEESKKFTAFQSDDGIYEYNVVPFGLKNAPTVFQKFMKSIIRDIPSAYVYLDDIIIASESKEQNVHEVLQVLQRLRDNRLRCRLDKCIFFSEAIDYLGHRVSAKGIQVQSAKVAAVMEGERPKDLQALRSFLGLSGYYRRFIRGYGSVAQPLTDLLRKGAEFKWSESQESAYQELKERLSSSPVLALPDPTLDYVLTTDASDTGIGAVLSQNDRPVAFYSKRLNATQGRYTTGEKELLAIVSSIEHFRHLLDGKKIIVETDHRNLVSALTRHKMNSRLVRAITYLQQFDVVLRYIDGKSNVVADHLSRHPPSLSSLAVFELSSHNFDDIVRETQQDAEAQDLLQKQIVEKRNGILYNNGKAFVPIVLRDRVMSAHHDGAHAGHRGIQTTTERIKRSFFWPSLEADVREYVGRCEICQTTKAGNTKPLGKTKPLEIPTQRFQQISIDFVTKLPETKRKKDAICVIVDTATKYAAFVPVCSSDSAARVAHICINNVGVKRFWDPARDHLGSGHQIHFKPLEGADAYIRSKAANVIISPSSNRWTDRKNHPHAQRVPESIRGNFREKLARSSAIRRVCV